MNLPPVEIVLLGEQHDDEDQHCWWAQVLAGLHALRLEWVIGSERFPRQVQPALSRCVAGALTRPAFLAQTGWECLARAPGPSCCAAGSKAQYASPHAAELTFDFLLSLMEKWFSQ